MLKFYSHYIATAVADGRSSGRVECIRDVVRLPPNVSRNQIPQISSLLKIIAVSGRLSLGIYSTLETQP